MQEWRQTLHKKADIAFSTCNLLIPKPPQEPMMSFSLTYTVELGGEEDFVAQIYTGKDGDRIHARAVVTLSSYFKSVMRNVHKDSTKLGEKQEDTVSGGPGTVELCASQKPSWARSGGNIGDVISTSDTKDSAGQHGKNSNERVGMIWRNRGERGLTDLPRALPPCADPFLQSSSDKILSQDAAQVSFVFTHRLPHRLHQNSNNTRPELTFKLCILLIM